MKPQRRTPVVLSLLVRILLAAIAISVLCGTVDYSRAKGGEALVFSRWTAKRVDGGTSDHFGFGYRVRVWESVSAGPMVPVSRDSVGADPHYAYTRRGAELRFVFLPRSFEAVEYFKWLNRDFMPPPSFGAAERSGGS